MVDYMGSIYLCHVDSEGNLVGEGVRDNGDLICNAPTRDGGFVNVNPCIGATIGGVVKFNADCQSCIGVPTTYPTTHITSQVHVIREDLDTIPVQDYWPTIINPNSTHINAELVLDTFLCFSSGLQECETGGLTLHWANGQLILRLPKPLKLSLSIYDVLGRLVARPYSNQLLPAGKHRVPLPSLPSGVFYGVVETGNTQRMLSFIKLD